MKSTDEQATSPSSRQSRVKNATLILMVSGVLWTLGVGAGLWIMEGYQNTPGAQAAPPAQWPAESRLRRAPEGATLVMVAHPHCPCTRASVGELAALMAQAGEHVTAYVLLLKPRGVANDWARTDLWNSAASIPGVQVLVDEGGAEAARFHTLTSGQTLLYDKAGRLLFSGGITASRGHSGDNEGRSAIISLLETGEAPRTATPVFGCPLTEPASACPTPKGVADAAPHN